ncbi:MAG: hypothetical protein J0G30_07165 [Actinomycetales bacterium]|nr:hypothetical protein [Actinomycetales bacterium]
MIWTLMMLAGADPTPVPIPGDPADTAEGNGPGVWGFVVTAFVAVVVILLVIDMVRRMRRVRYRDEVRAELDAEQAGRDAGR